MLSPPPLSPPRSELLKIPLYGLTKSNKSLFWGGGMIASDKLRTKLTYFYCTKLDLENKQVNLLLDDSKTISDCSFTYVLSVKKIF